ncbi:RNA polymerase sigma factor [Tardiphaga sp.]|uniref:RNA polymerase sigma factor n=1 Tax=Tardiphaga sp. TaxID=1926292 RepID=UPI00352ADC93
MQETAAPVFEGLTIPEMERAHSTDVSWKYLAIGDYCYADLVVYDPLNTIECSRCSPIIRNSSHRGGSRHIDLRGIVGSELARSYKCYRATAIKRLRDGSAADDVVQAFALKALERAEQLRDPAALHGWLRRLFETALIDFCRRRTANGRREVAFDIKRHDQLDETVADFAPDPAMALLATLPRLKPGYAETIYRLDLLDEPKQQVADQFGITLNNLSVRAHRARRALRAALETMPIAYLSGVRAL